MDALKKVIPQVVWDYTPVAVIVVGGYVTLKKIGSGLVEYNYRRRMLNKWKESPKDIIVVHRIDAGRTVPNCSPFVIKLETYLRMANLKYQVDSSFPMGPNKKKTPWITLNGEHIEDSQLIIEFLAKKYPKPVGEQYSKEQQSIGTMARLLMDEHAYWGLLHWRYVYNEARDIHKIFAMSEYMLKMFRRLVVTKVREACWIHGIGRHDPEHIIQIVKEDLEALSTFLGGKKYLLGDEPCVDDCAVFGELAQFLWAAPGSPYEKLMNEECKNLKEYCIRMKETFWPDWENCLAVSSVKQN